MADKMMSKPEIRRLKPEKELSEDGYRDDLKEERQNPDLHQKSRGRPNTVSRPPSSHITRVDEEPTGSDGSKVGGRSVETVDRGVGPTPHPPPVPVGTSSSDPRLPAYVSFQPLADHRNGLLDAYAAASLPYGYHPYGCPINTPLPLNPSTLEGRYHWPPASFPQTPHGLPSSPTPSDISLLSMRSPMLPGDHVTQLASRLHWEHLQRNYYHPLTSHRLSPAGIPGLSLVGASPLIADYPPPPSVGTRSFFSDVPPTPGSGSITLPGSLESSRLTSPRPSIVGGKSRKRALSHSPISDYLDIQSLTRSSEGSLQLASFLQPNSRSSSAASGSYGHLSAASVGTASPGHPLIPSSNPFLRQNPMAAPPFFYSPHFHPLFGRHIQTTASQGQMLPPNTHGHQMTHKPEAPATCRESHISTTTKEAGSSSIVSSTMDPSTDSRKTKVKKENENLHIDEEEEMYADRGDHMPQEGEPDFMETNCHWVDCLREFETQDELVKHINQDHIQSNKKSFVCRWTECSREEKPFKAQYMLVVHMRRHTGEKPHRCTFEGCAKAYSRLENLKTHLRSHTGEKPYMCEFPGCTKAFSNASDRAKHQNRTHSNAKPYVCKAIGCTKRYTDPSSLRKHVKTVHGPDFYANKKHKGDGSCNVKKEDPDGDDLCDVSHRMKMEDSLGVSPHSGPPSGDNHNSQDNFGSAPSSHSQPSPQSSPEVNVTCGLDQGQRLEDRATSGGDIGILIEEEEDIIVPESNEAQVPGSSALLTRRNVINANNTIQNRIKSRFQSKGNVVSPLPQLPSIHSPGDNTRTGEVSHVSISEIGHSYAPKGSPQHRRITDIVNGESTPWRENINTVLPGSRRESNTSTLSSYMSSMKSDAHGSTFSSRRSSGFSHFSSRRSSGASRWSIANSPYEYDITGNLPNPVSRRSSGESSTNIGNVSAMMQKANLDSHSSVTQNPPFPPPGGVPLPPLASANVAGASGISRMCHGMGAASQSGLCGDAGINSGRPGSNIQGNRCYNDRLSRYFSTRKEMDGMRTSTPSFTPLPHEIPNREIRRASDPVRTKDPNLESLNSLQRCHSLSMVKPLPTPSNMKSLHLHGKAVSTNTFHSSRSSIATDFSFTDNDNQQASLGITDAELEEKMLEDSEEMIIPDDMQRFLETYEGEFPLKDPKKIPSREDGVNGVPKDLEPHDSPFPKPDIANDPDPTISENSNAANSDAQLFFNQSTCPYPPSHQLLAGNLQVQTGFADLHSHGVSAGMAPYGHIESFQPSPFQRHNFAGNLAITSNWVMKSQPVPTSCPSESFPPNSRDAMSGITIKCEENQQQNRLCCPNYNSTLQGKSAQRFHTCTAENNNSSSADSRPMRVNNAGCHAAKMGDTIMGKHLFGNGPMQATNQNMGHAANLEQGNPNQHNIPPTSARQWGVGTGVGAYLSQQNLMQHQLHHQQLHQQQHQHQHQHETGVMSAIPLPFHPPHPGTRHGGNLMPAASIPQGGYSPMPPPGEKPFVTSSARIKRASPQVQVPHISQSQIPANAKAVNRNQLMLKQQEQQQPPQSLQESSLTNQRPPHQHPSATANDCYCEKQPGGDINQGHLSATPCHQLHQQQQNSQYLPFPTPHPPLNHKQNSNCNSQHMAPIHSLQMNSNPNSMTIGQNSIPPHHQNIGPYSTYPNPHQSLLPLAPSHYHPQLHSISAPHSSLSQSQVNPCHQQTLPFPVTPNDPYNPMEMSPGCNQVTSSTDCKETTAPPIEDFMDNLTSISTENLMDNINSISQDNIIMCSPTPASLRTMSQNSGRFNSLMNTSNMVVNDMSSVLTQLAEENKYLNMRP